MDSFIAALTDNTSGLKHFLLLALFAAAGLIVRWFFFKLFRWYNVKKPSVLKERLLLQLKGSTLFLVPFLFMYLALPFFELNAYWQKAIEILIIFNLGWLCIAILRTFEEVVKHKFQVKGNHKAKDRKVLTQLRFMKSMAMVIIITLTVATILWNIPKARQLGETILTSAGVLGIIIGVAAQKSIANLITGFQVAFTQTLKIDDEVMVEGEFGIVEDMVVIPTLVYC
ncbi:MAG: mechanosensitive ion channel family protein [Flavobacteriaceae bacterium]